LDEALLTPALSRALYRLSLVRYGLLTVITCAAGAAAGVEIPPATIAAVIPLVAAAAVLSFLPAGLGVNEWTFTHLLGLWGVQAEAAVEFAIANRLIVAGASVALGTLAALALLHRRGRPASAAPEMGAKAAAR
jgi:uncharacterized membrane protein YbhN (UPF0104 family)